MNFIIFNIPLICWITFFLTIWFETDIVTTIGNLTHTRKLLRIPEYEKYKLEEDLSCSYPNFLYEKYTGYLTKLLSCPICLCFWSTLITVNALTYKLGYSQLWMFLLFPVNYISSLVLYLIIKKLL
jgi:hypothetical protein